jgi:hypothetical protein
MHVIIDFPRRMSQLMDVHDGTLELADDSDAFRVSLQYGDAGVVEVRKQGEVIAVLTPDSPVALITTQRRKRPSVRKRRGGMRREF